jgi:hypothetical protein
MQANGKTLKLSASYMKFREISGVISAVVVKPQLERLTGGLFSCSVNLYHFDYIQPDA